MRMAFLANILRGVFMGSADVVPGVSGGTIAVLLGIYERLIAAISLAAKACGNLLRLDLRSAAARLRAVEWGLVLPLVIGIAVAIFTLARVITRLLDDYPEAMAGVFTGLVASSAWVAWRMIRSPDATAAVTTALVGIAAFLLLGISGGAVTDPSALVIFGAGAIAICAMILPGVSGSFLLLMLGMYDVVITAVDERDVFVLGVFALGAVVGLALFSQVLDWALSRHHDIVLAAMVGLMIGSLRVLWPWPGGVEDTGLGAPTGTWWIPVILGVIAALVVVGLTRMFEWRVRAAAG